MFKVIFFLGYLFLADSQSLLVSPRVDYADAPTPYQFSYTAPAIGGSSSHQESGDGNGRVTGSYSVRDDDGRSRIVEYVADEDGFRASISTNEPGTASQNPADVTIVSSADDGHGGTHVLASPAAAVAPAEPATSVNVASIPAPPPAPRPALVPIQPALVPFGPSLVPIQPTLLPPPPVFIPPPRRFFTQPAVFPFGAGRFVPRPTLVRFEPRQVVAPPALIPIQEAPLHHDHHHPPPALIPIQEAPLHHDHHHHHGPFFRGNFFGQPLEKTYLV